MKSDSYNNPGRAGGNLESVGPHLSIIEPEDTPYFSMIRKTGASSTFSEVVADVLRKPRITGTREGKGRTGNGNKSAKRQRFGVYQHRVFDEYGVTDVQQSVSKKGGNAVTKDERASAYAKGLREWKRDAESICLSDQECAGGNDDDMQTRGFFKWVQSAAQSVAPVPDDFRPPAASIITLGGSDVLTETNGTSGYKSFNAALKSIKAVYGKKVNIDAFCGDDIVEMIDNFTRTSSGGDGRYNVNEMAESHQITLSVSIFDTSFARVKVIPDQFVRYNNTTEMGRPRSAALCVREYMEIQFLEELMHKEVEDDGSGPSGWFRAKFAHLCSNPKGQGAIVG